MIVKLELLLTSIFQFLRPQKIMKFIHGGHFELKLICGGYFEFLNKTLKKSQAHLHIVENVIVKFEKILTLSFRVFVPTKNFGIDFCRPF